MKNMQCCLSSLIGAKHLIEVGIQSFITNGVRPSLIPSLISFQERKMVVKWHGTTSSTRDLPGGGPQGCTLGLLEYKSNSNNSADCVPADMRYKFVDDLSTLEKLNLILLGLSTYNFRSHVASDIGINQKYLPSANFQSQQYLNQIETWTNDNLMKLNVKKSKVMIFNYTENFQFSTRLYLENTLLEIITETKLLGTIITADLTWNKNTEMIVKKGYQRMIILHKLFKFKIDRKDMVKIYILYIRSILEQSCQVWHYSITEEEKSDLERVQKIACRIILSDSYLSYEQALQELNLDKLCDRRDRLCLKFAKNCLRFNQTKDMFPLNSVDHHNIRNREKYTVQHAKHSRLLNSAIPQLQRALNNDTDYK